MDNKNIQEDLQHIRTMMERSSRFISLSGLSGVVAGIIALVSAFYVYFLFESNGLHYFDGYGKVYEASLIKQLILIAFITLILAIGFGYFLTRNEAQKKNQNMWDATSKRLLFSFIVPLITGGFVCLGLIYHQLYVLLSPSTLIFYGLALVNAEKYTLSDVKYLGLCNVALGIVSLFVLGYGLVFWAVGFGVLHIVYGMVMHKKYK